MQYGSIQKGQFLRRLNRFSALVRIDGIEELCHVKNTGRLGELLLPENKLNYKVFRALCQEKFGDPYRIRTDVKGVRGLCLNHLTNGPFPCLLQLSPAGVPPPAHQPDQLGAPSGTRTRDPLIKSQLLYQLS